MIQLHVDLYCTQDSLATRTYFTAPGTRPYFYGEVDLIATQTLDFGYLIDRAFPVVHDRLYVITYWEETPVLGFGIALSDSTSVRAVNAECDIMFTQETRFTVRRVEHIGVESFNRAHLETLVDLVYKRGIVHEDYL